MMKNLVTLIVAGAIFLALQFPCELASEELRDFSFEESNVHYQSLKKGVEERIQEAVKWEAYDKAAMLCEKLLSDYQRMEKYLLDYQETWNKKLQSSQRRRCAWTLARCYAHLGDFDSAVKWRNKSGEIGKQEYWLRKTDEEIERCRKWLPALVERIEVCKKNPTDAAYGEIIEAYMELGEYGFALACMKTMMEKYPDSKLLDEQTYQRFHKFLMAYYSAKEPEREEPEPRAGIVKASNADVRAIFQQLWQTENERRDFARKKWERTSPVEKARLVNLSWSAAPPKGFDWKPTEREAEEFLKRHQSKYVHGSPGSPNAAKDWEDYMIYMVLTRVDAAPYGQETKKLIAELAAMGNEAIPDLMAKIQDGPLRSGASQECQWAVKALGEMGKSATQVLAAEIGNLLVLPYDDRASPRYGRVRYLTRALAMAKDPSTVSILVMALDWGDRSLSSIAFNGLKEIEGALTQELLLKLWEDEDELLRDQVARLLGETGDEKAIAILERDIPIAHPEDAYRAARAVWRIKKRLGEDVGDEPERPPFPSEWEGIEEGLKSPNKGIRIRAVWRLAQRKDSTKSAELLMDVALKDEDAEVRAAAREKIGSVFRRFIFDTMEGSGDLSSLKPLFDKLAELGLKGDNQAKATVLGCSYYFKHFKESPNYDKLCSLIIDAVQSEDIRLMSRGMIGFVQVFRGHPELLDKYLSPDVRQKVESQVVKAIDSDYGRLRVDAISSAQILKLKKAIPKLIDIIGNPKSHRRSQAARVLGDLGDPRALPALEKMSRIDPYVDQYGLYSNRETAWKAIHKIVSSGAKPAEGKDSVRATARNEEKKADIADRDVLVNDVKEAEKAVKAMLDAYHDGDWDKYASYYDLEAWAKAATEDKDFVAGKKGPWTVEEAKETIIKLHKREEHRITYQILRTREGREGEMVVRVKIDDDVVVFHMWKVNGKWKRR